MSRRSVRFALPPVSPVQMALISSPPARTRARPRPRALPVSTAHTKTLILAEARPRYPVSYIALSKQPRELSLALKLAAAPRQPGPLRIVPSSPHLVARPKSKVLDRAMPLSFQKSCPCPLSRRCANWRPAPPMPKFYSPAYQVPRDLPQLPRERLAKVLNPPPRLALAPISLARDHHALRNRAKPRATAASLKY
ncbi:hypothetical protein TKK_0004942 [Trichogramma kaykai]|uniref:Uncharacterized protein n=1 Tax=Trichogramma kaykai TaxID=54128 RepID=A0ABD2XJF4_9HYME